MTQLDQTKTGAEQAPDISDTQNKSSITKAVML
jgi:hypothetical protein